MDDHLKSPEPGVFGFMVHKDPVERCFDYATTHGFRHLEIDLTKKHSLIKTFTRDRIDHILRWCDDAGVSLSLHPPYRINFSTWFTLLRQVNLTILKKAIRLAHDLKAYHVTVHMGSFSRTVLWASQRPLALDRLVKGLDGVLKLCESLGVTLALENLISLRSESGFYFLGDNIGDFEYMFERLDSPYLKWCLDTGHANCSEGVTDYISRLGHKLAAVHVHDNRGEFDEHLQVGKGIIRWDNVVKGLREKNYSGPYIIECFESEPHLSKIELERLL